MSADLTINIVEGAISGQPPVVPASQPAPVAPVPSVPPAGVPMPERPAPAAVTPPPVVPPEFPKAPPVVNDRRMTEDERAALDIARRSNEELNRVSSGIVSIGNQLVAGIRSPSLDALVGITRSIAQFLIGQRVVDTARSFIRGQLQGDSPTTEAVRAAIRSTPRVRASRMTESPIASAGVSVERFGGTDWFKTATHTTATAGTAAAGTATAGTAAGTAGTAGAAAGGTVAAGIMTALTGPIGIAIGVIGGLTLGFIGALVVLRQWTVGLNRAIDELSQYSGVLAAQRGRQQFEMTLLEMERARRLEDPLSRIQMRNDALEQLQYRAATEFYAVGARFFDMFSSVFDGSNEAVSMIIAIMEQLGEFADMYLRFAKAGFDEMFIKELRALMVVLKVVLQVNFGVKFPDTKPGENLRDKLEGLLQGLAGE
jgi:hypothetical protein